MKIAGINILKISIPGVLIAFIYIFQYFGLPFLFYFKSEYILSKNLDESILILVFFYTSITITLLILGFIFGRISFGKLNHINVQNITPLNKKKSRILNLFVLICLIVLILYINKIGFQSLALLNAIGFFSDIDLEVSRSLMTNSFDGGYHWYKSVLTDLFSFIFLTVFVNSFFSKDSKKIYVVGLFIILVFTLMLSTEKGPVIILLISIYITYLILKKQSIVSYKYLIQVIIALFIILIIIYLYILNFRDLNSSISSIFHRIFIGQIMPAYYYIDYFPSKHDFLVGRTFPNPAGILPFTPFPLTQTISDYYSNVHSGAIGSSPTFFWGELYANFGTIGVLIIPFFVGYFLYFFNYFLLKLKPTPAIVGFYVWCILHFSYLSGTSLSTYLFDIYLLIVAFGFVVINWSYVFKFDKAVGRI